MAHTDVNDIQVHYQVRGSGPPLVLFQGFMGSSADWIHLFDLDDLARRHMLMMRDAPGHGKSTNPRGDFTHRECARDLLALLDGLGIRPFKAVGFSLGGSPLLHAATVAPHRVSAMVVIGAPSYFPTQARAIMATVTEETRTEDDWRMMRERHGHGNEQIRALWRIATVTHSIRWRFSSISTRAMPNARLYVIPEGGHDAVFGPARPDFVRTAIAFLDGLG